MSFAWRAELATLGEQIERGLREIPPQRLAQIRESWLGSETSVHRTERRAWWVIALTLTGLGALLLAAAALRSPPSRRGKPS